MQLMTLTVMMISGTFSGNPGPATYLACQPIEDLTGDPRPKCQPDLGLHNLLAFILAKCSEYQGGQFIVLELRTKFLSKATHTHKITGKILSRKVYLHEKRCVSYDVVGTTQNHFPSK
jgi:hypothetical protein